MIDVKSIDLKLLSLINKQMLYLFKDKKSHLISLTAAIDKTERND